VKTPKWTTMTPAHVGPNFKHKDMPVNPKSKVQGQAWQGPTPPVPAGKAIPPVKQRIPKRG
jgi:hypothetical protein